MAIAFNNFTAGKPMTATGRTGVQSIKLIPGPRVFVKTADSTTAAPIQNYLTKLAGTTPTGWTDLGIVRGAAKVVYNAKTTDIKTGIDNVLRGQYLSERTASIEFNLSQLDDVVLETVAGLTASVITVGSIVNYLFGQTDLNQMAIMLVATSKYDSKEWQFYNPNAYLNFTFDDQSDAMELKVTGGLPFFTALGATKESVLSTTIYA